MKQFIEGVCTVGKKMPTARTKAGDDEMVTCSINIKGLRTRREEMEAIAGMPAESMATHFDELGAPHQHMILQFPKRELLMTGKVEHRKESGAAIAMLELVSAAVSSVRFNLDIPVDGNPTSTMAFTLTWKAAGDEVENVKALLGRPCFSGFEFRDPPQEPLFKDSAPSPKAEAAAAKRTKPDRKSAAAGEKPDAGEETGEVDELIGDAKKFVATKSAVSPSMLQTALKIGYNRACRILEQLQGAGVLGPPNPGGMAREVLKTNGEAPGYRGSPRQGPPTHGTPARHSSGTPAAASKETKFEREARELAARNPRRESPPKRK